MPIVTDFGIGLDDGPLVPLAEVGERGGLHVLAPADADPQSLAVLACRQRLIAVAFEKFTDGRGFSVARRLRDLGYRGRLRAHGWLIPDQFAYARACGFDEVQVPDDMLARQGAEVWERAGAAPVPPFQRRVGAALQA
jgi:uncharacterized protein (DUF934 family)